tara:strand:+ start:567 stop:1184 length:618 start_codon:yes stop_codon:yes gene_type:complete
MSKRVLVDYIGSITVSPSEINESMSKNNGKLIVSGIMQRGSSDGDKNFNQNGRSYPLPILKKETENYKGTFVKERRALGELDHPDSQVVNLSNVSHNIVDLWWQGNDLMGKLEILSTPSGNIAKELLKSGIRLGISSRGMGSVKELGEGKVEVQNDFEIVCWDLVSNPSTQGAFMNASLNENTIGSSNSKYSKINSLISEIISVM